jgi:hypothetical protein
MRPARRRQIPLLDTAMISNHGRCLSGGLTVSRSGADVMPSIAADETPSSCAYTHVDANSPKLRELLHQVEIQLYVLSGLPDSR